jgi:hypothetical protein
MAPRSLKLKGTIHPTKKRCIAEDFSQRQTLQQNINKFDKFTL